jgi:hypothetical protein
VCLRQAQQLLRLARWAPAWLTTPCSWVGLAARGPCGGVQAGSPLALSAPRPYSSSSSFARRTPDQPTGRYRVSSTTSPGLSAICLSVLRGAVARAAMPRHQPSSLGLRPATGRSPGEQMLQMNADGPWSLTLWLGDRSYLNGITHVSHKPASHTMGHRPRVASPLIGG